MDNNTMEKVSKTQQAIWDSFDELEEQIKNGTYKPKRVFRFHNPKFQLPAPSPKKPS
jgi:hypothetical protein